MPEFWKPTEEELAKARRATGGAVFDAINVHGQDDFKAQPLKRGAPSPKMPYCSRCHSYFCPHVAPRLYRRPGELEEALRAWETKWPG